MQQSLSKSEFLLFLESPKHFWAGKHDKLQVTLLPDYDRFLMEQGNEVHALVKSFFRERLFSDTSQYKVSTEKSFTDGPLINRVDILVHDLEEDIYDVYEVKSSTSGSIKKAHKYDVAFQQVVVEKQLELRNVYLVLLNKEYVKDGELDLDQLFVTVNMEEHIAEVRDEVRGLLDEAMRVIDLDDPGLVESCFKPSTCPCPALCHPDLPEYSIYELSRLGKNKASRLRSDGIVTIKDVPEDFGLSERQQLQIEAVKKGEVLIDHPGISEFLADLEYPLYFLDYETLGFAVPVFDGYSPYQPMVFQYSLHVQEKRGGEVSHFEYLADQPRDPGILIVEDLSKNIGDKGSVIVWNKSFEIGRNKEMAELYPQHTDFLLGLNQCVFDLMETFSKTLYIHPDFRGSASLKRVLPIVLPELGESYAQMEVSDGSDAMLAWRELIWGNTSSKEADRMKKALRKYCELDTFAMVELLEMISPN